MKEKLPSWTEVAIPTKAYVSWAGSGSYKSPFPEITSGRLTWSDYCMSLVKHSMWKKKTLKLQWALQLSHIINTLRSLTCSREILMLSVEQMNWSTSQAPRPLTLYLDTWLHFSWFSSSQLSWHCEDWITCQPLNVLPFCEDCWSLGDYKTV